MSKSILVLISGNGSNLQAILDACESGRISGKISAVISNRPEVYGLTRARNHGVEAIVVDHKDFDSREEYDAKLAEVIDEFSPDLVVLAGFMRILTDDFVKKYVGRMINIHPSLLPKYPGIKTHKRVLEEGDVEHGASIHFVIPELDAGPVILQSKVPVFETDTEEELAQRVHVQEHAMYPLVVQWFCSDRLKMEGNHAVLDNEALPVQGYASE